MARLRTAYVIEMGWGNQPSDFTEVKISKKDYENIKNTPCSQKIFYNGREIYSIVDSYMAALYITQS